MVRPSGTADLQPKPTKSLSLTASPSPQDTTALVDELHGILRELPMEEPVGSQDIYGLDTGIVRGAMTWNGRTAVPRNAQVGRMWFRQLMSRSESLRGR